MNLEKMSAVERLDLCRKYFFIGLACLPVVWLVNCAWFYRFAFCPQAASTVESKSLKKYVIMSIVGLVSWTILICLWLITYTMSRTGRAEWAEWITFILPLGRV